MDDLTPQCDHQTGCITCGDEAISMYVVTIDADRGLALCTTEAGAHSTVETLLVEPVATGDLLLVHAGTAIAKPAPAEVAA